MIPKRVDSFININEVEENFDNIQLIEDQNHHQSKGAVNIESLIKNDNKEMKNKEK